MNKTNRCTEFQFYWYYDSICFGQPFCPSSGLPSRTSALVRYMQLWWPYATRSRMARAIGSGILRSECDGTRWRTGGEVKGKLANGVGSQHSHTTSERGVSTITNACAHTSAASSRLNWLPRRFKWTSPFKRKTKCGFCACAIRFRTSSTLYAVVVTVCYQK